jgi:hypothetical protein
VTLREEHTLRVFENRVLIKIFVPKRDEMTGGWRKLHYEELRDLIKSRRMRWAVHVARMQEKRNVYRLVVGKPKGKQLRQSLTSHHGSLGLIQGQVMWDLWWVFSKPFNFHVKPHFTSCSTIINHPNH